MRKVKYIFGSLEIATKLGYTQEFHFYLTLKSFFPQGIINEKNQLSSLRKITKINKTRLHNNLKRLKELGLMKDFTNLRTGQIEKSYFISYEKFYKGFLGMKFKSFKNLKEHRYTSMSIRSFKNDRKRFIARILELETKKNFSKQQYKVRNKVKIAIKQGKPSEKIQALKKSLHTGGPIEYSIGGTISSEKLASLIGYKTNSSGLKYINLLESDKRVIVKRGEVIQTYKGKGLKVITCYDNLPVKKRVKHFRYDKSGIYTKTCNEYYFKK